MTTTTLRRPLAPVVPLAWQTRAACRDSGPDLTEIDEDSPAAELAAARALCRGCDVIGECRAVALGVTDFAGVAGGLTEAERAHVRAARGITVQPVGAADVLRSLALADLASEPCSSAVTDQRLPEEFIEEVARLTVEGCLARDIADILADSLPGVPITVKTVAYARALHAGTRTRGAR